MLDLRPPSAGALSPDGKRLFFNWAITGVQQVFRVDGAGRFPTQLTGGEDVTTLLAVTRDGKQVVLARDRKGEENPGLYLQDALRGGELTVVQHKPGVQTHFQALGADGRSIYFTANDKKRDSYVVYRYDLVERRSEPVVEADGLWRVVDTTAEGALLLQKATGALSSELWEWSPKTKQLAPLLGQGEAEEYRAAWGHGGEVLVQTSKLGDFRRLYTLAGGKLTPITEERRADVSGFSVDPAKTRVLYQVDDGGRTRLFAMDARTKRPLALPKLPEADHVNAGATTPDGRFTTLSVDDGAGPRRAYVIDWKTGKAEPWHQPSAPELATESFAKAELAHYPARDGASIPAWVRKPARCPDDPCAVVVHFHGGPESQARPGFSASAQMWVDAGFVYVEPNVRGSDGLGKAWLHADDGPKRLDVITDIEDASRWVKKAFERSGKAPKVGVYGGSYGGYSTLIGMTMFAGAYDAGVDVVGMSSLVTFLENTAPYRRQLRISEYGDPVKDREALLKLSPITHLDKLKAPLLILQGATDPRVPAGEAIQLHDALAAKGVSTKLMIFPNEGHGAQRRENQALMLGHSIAFMKKHLQGR
ncbi:MAG: S9 family peptidase [Polyangiaceae bacterium]|nr:S9 family peptidase [Polyangiaceae bacterium]